MASVTFPLSSKEDHDLVTLELCIKASLILGSTSLSILLTVNQWQETWDSAEDADVVCPLQAQAASEEHLLG